MQKLIAAHYYQREVGLAEREEAKGPQILRILRIEFTQTT